MQQLLDLSKKYPNIAYAYAALGNIALGINQILIKKVSTYIAPSQALFYRTFILAVIGYFILQRQGKSVYIADHQIFRKAFWRVTFVGGAATGMYQCLKYLPVSTVTTIWNISPLLIFFIEAIHYKSSINLSNFLLTLLSFAGVVLMIQPQFIFGESSAQKGENYYVFIGIMLFAAVANSLNLHFVHLLYKKLDPTVNIFYSYLGFLATSGLLSAYQPSSLTQEQLTPALFLLIFGIAFTGFFLQNMIILANSLKKPSLMMPFGYIGVVTGLLADIYLFDTSFSFLTYLGVFLTSGGLLSGFLIQKDKTQSIGELNQKVQKELQPIKKLNEELQNEQFKNNKLYTQVEKVCQ